MTATLDDFDTFLFADGDLGHVCDLGSAPDVGDLDVLCIVSNTVVDSLAGQGFVISSDNESVTNMGMYLWRRIAVGGEASTVTVSTVGNHNTFVGWTRWKNVVAADDAGKSVVNGTPGSTTPSLTSNPLAETNELVVAFGGLHTIGAANQNTPIWTGGFTGLLAGTQGSGADGVVGYVGYRTDAGTAAVSPNVSWSGATADDRGMMLLTFTTSEPVGSTAVLDAVAPAATSQLNATASSSGTLSITAPGATASINATASSSGVLGPTAPAPVVSINGSVEELGTAVLDAVAPSPSLSLSTFGNPIFEEMIAAHPYLGPLMVEALQCLCEETARIPNPPQHCCFRVGTEIIHDAGFSVDQCCEGIAYVALGDLFPSAESFPEQDIVRQSAANCKPPAWGVYLKMGIIRCIDVGGMDPMSCTQWDQAALQNLYDTVALTRTSCCIRNFIIHESEKFVGWSAIIDRQVQGNPLGGCVERSLTMAIQFPNCEC